MKRIILLILCIVILSACTAIEVNNFESCVSAGNPVMESYPRQCNHDGITYVEEIEDQLFQCQEEQRYAEICITLYDPVCADGYTYSNSCFACKEPSVEYYTMGECS